MKVTEPTGWVVYVVPQNGRQPASHNAVCTQGEWDAMEANRPGFHTLIRDNIRYEGEAEQLARDLQTPPAAPTPARMSYSAMRAAERAKRLVPTEG